MRTSTIALLIISAVMLTGCASDSEKTPTVADVPVQLGMTRADLKAFYGEPLRIVPGAHGEEDWYYHFRGWKTRPVGHTEVTDDFGEKTSSVSLGLEFSKPIEERPIHISADGYVVSPLPTGKLVKD